MRSPRPSSFRLVALVAVLVPAGVTCSAGSGEPKATGSGGASGSTAVTGSSSSSTATTGSTSGSGGAASASSSSGASTSSSGAGGTSAAGQCPANAIFCADFESGTIPAAAVYYPAYQQSTIATYMTVDGTMGNHGSAHALKVTPGTNFSQMLGVKTGVSTFWTRVYLQTATVNTSAVTGHDTFIAGVDDSASGGTLANAGDPNNGEQVRVGEHECQLELNRKSDDKEILSDAVGGVSNYVCMGGVTFSPGTWYCVEALYDGPNSAVRVFVNGAEVTALHVTDWGPHTYDMFKFGFENYSGTPRNLWYDDVVIAPQRIGCFP